jgi:hypothetical protein
VISKLSFVVVAEYCGHASKEAGLSSVFCASRRLVSTSDLTCNASSIAGFTLSPEYLITSQLIHINKLAALLDGAIIK